MGGVGEEEKHNQRILYNFLIKMKSKTMLNDRSHNDRLRRVTISATKQFLHIPKHETEAGAEGTGVMSQI